MEKENKEIMDKNEKKELKMKEKQAKKEAKMKVKQEKKEKKATQNKKEKRKMDKFTVCKKILAAFLVAFTILGTCYTFIYLMINR